MPLFDTTTLLAYSAAAAVLVLIPGPGTAWIVGQTIAGGTRRGIRAGFGLETATLIHALAAGLGLSAVLATSALAFEAIKYAGAGYLIWLGIKAWLDHGAQASGPTKARPAPVERNVYVRSVVTGVLNPKVALFFLAFLPQFVHPERGLVPLQFVVLGLILSVIGLSHSVAIAFALGRFGRQLSTSARTARWRQRIIGTVFIGLGLRLAAQDPG